MNRVKRLQHEHEKDQDPWLITYSDAVTLLLTFFVLLLAVSTIDQSKFEEVVEALSKGTVGNASSAFDTVESRMKKLIEENQLHEDVMVTRTPKGVNIDFASAIFFNIGSEEILKNAYPILQEVAAILQDFEFNDYVIAVEGHTDNIPISTAKIASNWELSAMRASNTIRFLIAHGVQKQFLKAIGYADIRPKLPNLDDKGDPIRANQAKNRRVAIKIERNY